MSEQKPRKIHNERLLFSPSRPKRTLSAAARKAIGARMKAYWAARRKAKS